MKKIFIAGHKGMVGSAIYKNISKKNKVIVADKKDLNLLNFKKTFNFFKKHKFDHVYICAAKVGGILANDTYRADFIYQNLQIATNIIKSSHDSCVEKLINLGSSCIYPKNPEIPIKEESLLTGALEDTNEPYAIAKICALKMCENFYQQYGSNFYSLMPCNLYGPGDNFDLETSHVLPAFINKVHTAKENGSKKVEIWGSGKPLREFLFVEDLADAIVFCLENLCADDVYKKGISQLNCGSNDEVSILQLINLIKEIVGFEGEITFDSSKPDGTYRKKMDNSKIESLGFTPKNTLKQGIKKTYDWYVKNIDRLR